MDTRAPGTLPPRDRASVQPAHVSARRKDRIVTTIVVAGILVLVVAAFAPRPDIIVQDVTYTAPGCGTSGVAQGVTASFTLFNRGAADGTLKVGLLVDGSEVASQTYTVLSHAQVPGQVEATIPDCSAHRYGLLTLYETPPGG